jgi:hypothetical protein
VTEDTFAPEESRPMSVMMSWARTTLANVEHALARSDRWLDRLLVGAGVLLVVALALMFLVAR